MRVRSLLAESALPPGFEDFGFDEPSSSHHSSNPGDVVGQTLGSCKYGSIVQVGSKRFRVFKASGMYVTATMDGSAGRKAFDIRPEGPHSDKAEVWEINGLSERTKKVMVGPLKKVS